MLTKPASPTAPATSTTDVKLPGLALRCHVRLALMCAPRTAAYVYENANQPIYEDLEQEMTGFTSTTENALTTRMIHLTEAEVLAGDDGLGLATAFRYAAHTWMSEVLDDKLHNQGVCDRFEEWHNYVGVGFDGAMHFAMKDGVGDVWHFFGVAPADGLLRKVASGE